MGFEEHGNGELGLSAIPLGTKNKYRRMGSDNTEDCHDGLDQYHQQHRRQSTRKYVIACAIFASLNNVLLGYGMLTLFPLFVFLLQNMCFLHIVCSNHML